MANHYQYSQEKPLAQPTGTSIGVVSSAHSERHYAVVEIAQLWNLSTDKVRELFENEPGNYHCLKVVGKTDPEDIITRLGHFRIGRRGGDLRDLGSLTNGGGLQTLRRGNFPNDG